MITRCCPWNTPVRARPRRALRMNIDCFCLPSWGVLSFRWVGRSESENLTTKRNKNLSRVSDFGSKRFSSVSLYLASSLENIPKLLRKLFACHQSKPRFRLKCSRFDQFIRHCLLFHLLPSIIVSKYCSCYHHHRSLTITFSFCLPLSFFFPDRKPLNIDLFID